MELFVGAVDQGDPVVDMWAAVNGRLQPHPFVPPGKTPLFLLFPDRSPLGPIVPVRSITMEPNPARSRVRW